MTRPSSKEIEAALVDAIACMEGATDRTYTAALLAARTATLRAHLSRLREEAEFRDAAREYIAWCETSNREIAEIDTGKTFAWINRLGELQHALRLAYRALEEPRDG